MYAVVRRDSRKSLAADYVKLYFFDVPLSTGDIDDNINVSWVRFI